jgi:hypothetical protein
MVTDMFYINSLIHDQQKKGCILIHESVSYEFSCIPCWSLLNTNFKNIFFKKDL